MVQGPEDAMRRQIHGLSTVLMAGATEETNNASSMYYSYVLAEG
jgi:hypothetical protein